MFKDISVYYTCPALHSLRYGRAQLTHTRRMKNATREAHNVSIEIGERDSSPSPPQGGEGGRWVDRQLFNLCHPPGYIALLPQIPHNDRRSRLTTIPTYAIIDSRISPPPNQPTANRGDSEKLAAKRCDERISPFCMEFARWPTANCPVDSKGALLAAKFGS